MVGTIKSIFDSVEIENEENKEEYVLYETPIPAEVYGANVELISIPHPNIQNIHKIESNNKKLFQKAIELNTRVKELKDEIKELRKVWVDSIYIKNSNFIYLLIWWVNFFFILFHL